MDTLTQFHVDNKYYILVKKLLNGCYASFPANYLVEPPIIAKNYHYQMCDEGITISDSANNYNMIFEIEKYAARFGILTDILIKTKSLNLPNKLIVINDGIKEVKSLISILPSPTNDEDKHKELLVQECWHDISIGLFDVASANKLGILRGYEQLNQLIDSGGLVL